MVVEGAGFFPKVEKIRGTQRGLECGAHGVLEAGLFIDGGEGEGEAALDFALFGWAAIGAGHEVAQKTFGIRFRILRDDHGAVDGRLERLAEAEFVGGEVGEVKESGGAQPTFGRPGSDGKVPKEAAVAFGWPRALLGIAFASFARERTLDFEPINGNARSAVGTGGILFPVEVVAVVETGAEEFKKVVLMLPGFEFDDAAIRTRGNVKSSEDPLGSRVDGGDVAASRRKKHAIVVEDGPAANAIPVPARIVEEFVLNAPGCLRAVRLPHDDGPTVDGADIATAEAFEFPLAKVAALLRKPGPQSCRLRRRTELHRSVDGDFGGFKVAGHLDVRYLLGFGHVVETVCLGVGREHFFEFEPGRVEEVAQGVFELDGVEAAIARAASLDVALAPGLLQGGVGVRCKVRHEFRGGAGFVLGGHFARGNAVANFRPNRQVKRIGGINFEVKKIEAGLLRNVVVAVVTMLSEEWLDAGAEAGCGKR